MELDRVPVGLPDNVSVFVFKKRKRENKEISSQRYGRHFRETRRNNIETPILSVSDPDSPG